MYFGWFTELYLSIPLLKPKTVFDCLINIWCYLIWPSSLSVASNFCSSIFWCRTSSWPDSGPKLDLSASKRNLSSANKHMPFGSRDVQFWTSTDQFFWSEVGIRAGDEQWDDGNIKDGDWSTGSDEETSNNINIYF